MIWAMIISGFVASAPFGLFLLIVIASVVCSPITLILFCCCKKRTLFRQFRQERVHPEDVEIPALPLRRRRRRRRDHRRRGEGFSDVEFLKLIEVCGKTLNKEELNDSQNDRYNCESNCSICLGPWEEN
jgi:hypothetical protein